MEIAGQRPVGNKGVRMIRRRAEDRVQIRVIEAFAPVLVKLRVRKRLNRGLAFEAVDVAEGDHVFFFESLDVRAAAPSSADEGDIELVARGVLPKQGSTGQDREAGSGDGGLTYKVPARDCGGGLFRLRFGFIHFTHLGNCLG